MPLDDFAAVDAASEQGGATDHLVAMMHATDAWPAVCELREWVLGLPGIGPGLPGGLVLDVGCGPGTFSRLAVTDTDWSSFAVEHDDAAVCERMAAAARAGRFRATLDLVTVVGRR